METRSTLFVKLIGLADEENESSKESGNIKECS